MATTITLELKKQATSQGKFPIYIRITKDRKSKRIKTSVALDRVADWNAKKKEVRASCPDAAVLNEALKKEMQDAEGIYREDRAASLDALKDSIKQKDSSDSFITFLQDFVAARFDTGATSAKHYQTLKNKLQGYLQDCGREDITFKEVTPSFLNKFKSFLQKETNARCCKQAPEQRLNPNYIRTLFVKFRAAINAAVVEGKMPKESYPFGKGGFQLEKAQPTSREALDASELDALQALELEEGSALWHTRNAFFFSFYCAGIRVADLLQLRWKDIRQGKELQYTMDKNSKPRKIELVKQAQQILSFYSSENEKPLDYIFPFLPNVPGWAKFANNKATMPLADKDSLFNQIYSKNVLLNRNLKKLAAKAGIDKNLTFHISRHTFASLAREENLSPKLVQEALAHSNLSTTEGYMHNFADSEVNDAMQKLFNSLHQTDKEGQDNKENLVKMLKELIKELDK